MGDRHRRAATDGGEPQHPLREARRQIEHPPPFIGPDPDGPVLGRDRGAWPEQERERHHRHRHEDAEVEKCSPPSHEIVEILHDGGPYRSGQSLAGREDRDRESTPPVEPARHIGNQRRDHRRLAEQADEQAGRDEQVPAAFGVAREQRAEADHHRTEEHRLHDAVFVHPPAHRDAADTRADHHQASTRATGPRARCRGPPRSA